MREHPNMRGRRRAGHVGLHDERGAAMAEYLPLLAVIGLVVFFSFAYAGPWAYDQFIDASIALYGDNGCPEGEYELIHESEMYGLSMPNGADRDLNEDGWYCMKSEASQDQDLPGNGNNGNNADIKDNNRPNP